MNKISSWSSIAEIDIENNWPDTAHLHYWARKIGFTTLEDYVCPSKKKSIGEITLENLIQEGKIRRYV